MFFWVFEWVIFRLFFDDEDIVKFGDDVNFWFIWLILFKFVLKVNIFIISFLGIFLIEL